MFACYVVAAAAALAAAAAAAKAAPQRPLSQQVAGKGTTTIGFSKHTATILSIGNIKLNTINRNAFGNLPCDFKINTSLYKPQSIYCHTMAFVLRGHFQLTPPPFLTTKQL